MTNGEANMMTAGVQEMSAAARFFGVFTEPSKTFADIARKPGFWAPLIVLIVFSFVSVETLIHKVGMEQIVRHSIEVSGRASTMSPEQMQTAVSQGAKFAGIITPIAGLIGIPILIFIISAIGLLILKVIFGSTTSFKTAFSVTAHAYLPLVLASILAIIVILFGDPANMNPQNLTPTNIGFFLSRQSAGSALYSLATSIDFFSFWVLGLLGIGFSATTGRKVKPKSMFFAFLVLWAIYVLIRAGLSLL
ncbi:MAG TPA: YIP1 family protein [Terriglobia bacterium]|nr:YIP1 family protein [Terriglobia bacterium]